MATCQIEHNMPNNSQENPLLNELVTFIQHDMPGLPDGEYQLTVSQRVKDSVGNLISDDSLSNSYKFAVLGDRFRLKNPDAVVYTVFPAANGSGEYSTVLPHVVFTKSTFPWSRYPTSKELVKPPPPGTGTDANVPTWLTVLLLDEDDVSQYPSLSLEPGNATIGDLFPTKLFAQSTLCNNYSYFEQAKDTSAIELNEQLSDTIQVLDIPLALFWKIAPTIDDLSLLAHVRKVSLVNKPTMNGISDVGEPVGSFSIVFGTRLPQTGKRTFAYLVSLEELEPFLPTDEDGGPPDGNSFDSSLFLRLAVLKSWSFSSTGETATFVDQLLRLNGRKLDSPTNAVNSNLRLLYSGSNTLVRNALDMGYVPLNHELRTGGKTVSWYRGPLVPYSITTPGLSFPIASPDQAMVFDPTTGMLDNSYAAAWAAGRMIALQDKAFSTALYNWKKGLTQQAVNSIEEEIMQEQFGSVLGKGGQPAAHDERVQTPRAKMLIHQVIQTLQPKQR
jgi:hypothetical protein